MTAKLAILRLQARAFRRYGLTAEQVLSLTPSEYQLIERDALREIKFAESHADFRMGMICAAIYNNNLNRKKGAKRHDWKDFQPRQQPKRASANNLLAKWTTICNMFSTRTGSK